MIFKTLVCTISNYSQSLPFTHKKGKKGGQHLKQKRIILFYFTERFDNLLQKDAFGKTKQKFNIYNIQQLLSMHRM